MRTSRSIALAVLVGTCLSAQQSAPDSVVSITTPVPVPAWALLQRKALEANSAAARQFAAKYTRPNGQLIHQLRWGGNDGPDDAMETFWNWPLLYALGGDADILPLWRRIWEAHLKDYTEAGMLHREFNPAFDWEHNGEHYTGFLHEGLADPTDEKFKERTRRFAGFYTGEDPAANNYDPKKKLIRSVLNGSKGALLEVTPDYWYDKRDPQRADYFASWTTVRGDIPLNLAATSLVANAYLLTGDQKYAKWIEEYAGEWVERAKANNGDFPGNVGISGITGEHFRGDWSAGMMGWNWTFGGFQMMLRGILPGMLNAHLVSAGSPSYMGALRAQMDNLFGRAPKGAEDISLLPDRYSREKEWHDHGWRVIYYRALTDLYLNTLDSKDFSRLLETMGWGFTAEDQRAQKDYGHESEWAQYLQGKNPVFPETVLQKDLERIRRFAARARADRSDPETWRSDHTHNYLPVTLEGLCQLMLGAPTPLWSSGLLHSAQVRYFDPVEKRAGIPKNLGTLVYAIGKDRIRIALTNTSLTEDTEVIVQAGGYGEHTFTTALLLQAPGAVITPPQPVQVGRNRVRVKLAPGAGGSIELGIRRNSSKPSLAQPW